MALQYGKQISGDYAGGTGSVCSEPGICHQYKRNGTDARSDAGKFCGGGNQCSAGLSVDFWCGTISGTWGDRGGTCHCDCRYVEAVIVVLWAHRNREKNRYLEGAYRGFGIPVSELKTILIKGLPLMFNEVLWAAGMTTVTQCYSVRGLDVVAGLNIATTITNLFNIVYIQLGACISIVVGQYLGAGELEKAKDADNKMIVFSVFCCVIMAAIMFLVGGFFPDIYNTTAEIKDLATKFIAVSALIMPFCSFSHASYFTLRSGGKTMVTFLFDSVFTWVVVVPVAFLLAHGTGLGIVSVIFWYRPRS